MRKKRKAETSKLLLWVLLSGLGIIAIVTIVYSFLCKESDPLVTLIDGVTKLATIAVGFYYWKAKNENLHKYNRDEMIGEQRDYEE